jgi:DNA polymerase-4
MAAAVQPVFFHVDMDAFFASVEQHDKPEFKGKPVIVGALPGHRGVVSTCSYEARAYGVHSAMPISEAYRRCPHGVFLPVRMERYHEVSLRIMEIFAEYTPCVQQISVDEAFLDMTGTRRLFGPPESLAAKIKARVREDTGLTISVGVAPNRYLAKIASACRKPDGLCVVKPGEEERFVGSLRLDKLWGLGEKTLLRLSELNIRSVVELRAHGEASLKLMLGNAAGEFLYRIARGIDPGIFSGEPKSRSISAEVTFEQDSSSEETLSRALLELSHQTMFRLLRESWRSKTVALKLRLQDFTTTNAQRTLRHYVSSAEELHAVAVSLLRSRWDGRTPVRLIGVGLSSLEPLESAVQSELFEDEYDRKRKVEQAVLMMKRAGGPAVTKASLLGRSLRNRPPERGN